MPEFAPALPLKYFASGMLNIKYAQITTPPEGSITTFSVIGDDNIEIPVLEASYVQGNSLFNLSVSRTWKSVRITVGTQFIDINTRLFPTSNSIIVIYVLRPHLTSDITNVSPLAISVELMPDTDHRKYFTTIRLSGLPYGGLYYVNATGFELKKPPTISSIFVDSGRHSSSSYAGLNTELSVPRDEKPTIPYNIPSDPEPKNLRIYIPAPVPPPGIPYYPIYSNRLILDGSETTLVIIHETLDRPTGEVKFFYPSRLQSGFNPSNPSISPPFGFEYVGPPHIVQDSCDFWDYFSPWAYANLPI
jgi:hypothetical protein